MKTQFLMQRDRLAALLLAGVLFFGPENSRAEVSEKPQQLRNTLARQLPENGLPAPSDLLLDGGTLRISFAAGADSKLREAKDLLPVLLIAYSAMRESGVAAGQINVRAPLPDGETLLAEATTEVLGSYLAKEITPQEFAAAVRSEVLPWEPSGQTRKEIIEAYFERGREMADDQERYDQALPLFKEVYEMDPEYPKVNKAMAVCLVETNDPISALPYLAKAREQMPDDDNAVLAALLVRKVYEGGDYARALALAEDFLSQGDLKPESARCHLMARQAQCLFNLARYPEAEARSRALVKSFPESFLAWFRLAEALNIQKKYPELLAAAQKASDLDPTDADACFLLAVAQMETGKYREAVRSLERVRELLGGQTPGEGFFISLSYCYAKLNNAAMCMQVAGEGLKIYPGNEILQKNYKAGYKAQLKK